MIVRVVKSVNLLHYGRAGCQQFIDVFEKGKKLLKRFRD